MDAAAFCGDRQSQQIAPPSGRPAQDAAPARPAAQTAAQDIALGDLGDFEDILSDGDGSQIGALLERYDDAGEFGQQRILGICANFPGDDRILSYMLDKLRNRPDQRALYASFLGKLGDPRAIDAMKPFLTLTDIGYLDYIELRNAIEELGGDPGEERTFYGDPDYEAMRNI